MYELAKNTVQNIQIRDVCNSKLHLERNIKIWKSICHQSFSMFETHSGRMY